MKIWIEEDFRAWKVELWISRDFFARGFLSFSCGFFSVSNAVLNHPLQRRK